MRIIALLLLTVAVLTLANRPDPTQPTVALIPTISGCCCTAVRGVCPYPYKFIVSVYNGNSFNVMLLRNSYISYNATVESNTVQAHVLIDDQPALTCSGGAMSMSGNMGDTNTATVCIKTVTTSGTVVECNTFTEPDGGCPNPSTGGCVANSNDCNMTP